jgi:hypothetical protein
MLKMKLAVEVGVKQEKSQTGAVPLAGGGLVA